MNRKLSGGEAAINLKVVLQYVMKKEGEITLNPKTTYTKMEYSRAYDVSRPTIDKMIKAGDLKIIEVKGAVLILK